MPTEGGAKKKTVDVRKSADVKALEEILKKHPITIILIHADWCGHCQTYKKNVWSKLQDLPNRKNGLAAIHHDQLEGTQFANAKIRGYPSVILVGKKNMAEFEDEEGPTNALPTEQANDTELMESLATSAEPSTLTGTLKNMKSNVDTASEEESPELSEEAKESRELSAYSNKKPTAKMSPSPLIVPDPSKDTLDTQEPSAQMSTEFNKADIMDAKKGGGGSLYESLLAATRVAAPVAALVGAAAVLSKSNRKTKRSKRSKRKSRRSRRS